MTIQRLGFCGYKTEVMVPRTDGAYVHYNSHKAIVDLLYDQLELLQDQLENERSTVSKLLTVLENVK